MFYLVLALLVPIFLFFHMHSKHRQNGKRLGRPPGPSGLPIIGNLHQMDGSAPHMHLAQLANKYGPLMHMRLGCKPVIVVSSASLAKEVMKNQEAVCCNRPSLSGLQVLTYGGKNITFSPCDEKWREMRKILSLHMLSSKRIQSFGPIREDEVHRMINKLAEHASESRPANLSEMTITLSIKIICRVAFGKTYGAQETGRFGELISEFLVLAGSFFVSDFIPPLGWIDKLTGLAHRLGKNFGELDSFYDQLINERLNPLSPSEEDGDVLQILLRLRQENSSGMELTLDRIKAMLMDIFVGGTDTTAATMTWAMTALVKNPNVMKKVQGEIRRLEGKKGRVDENDIQKLPFLKAVIKETLRLYSPVPILPPRQPSQNCILDGYEIDPKTMIYVNAWAIARDPSFWENPEQFLPERFLDGTIDYLGQDFEFVPFGAGRRICPGMFFSLATVEIALANFLYSFDWNLPAGMNKEDIDTNVKPGFVAHKKDDLYLVPKIYALD